MTGRASVPAIIAAVLAGVGVVAGAVLLDRIPEPAAMHWGPDLRPDGSGPRWMLPILPVALLAGVSGLSLGGGRRGLKAVWRSGTAPGVAAVGLGVEALAIRANLDALTWREADKASLLAVTTVLALGAVAGIVSQRLAGWPDRASGPVLSAGLVAGERAAFVGWARARWTTPVVAVLLVVGAAGMLANSWTVTAAGVGSAILTANFASVRVRVDRGGVEVMVGSLHLPRSRIALTDIVEATAIDELEPMEWGGWGYRGSLALMGKAAVVIRRGEALVLELTGGRRFAVTVDGAAVAAGLVNDLRRT